MVAQHTEYPLIGAQVFIEPGQTEAQVRQWFRLLHDSHMEVARIRLFESHMRKADGSWDYSLYDAAFDEAQRQGVRLFCTLFPACADDDLGGPKFPADNDEFRSICDFIAHVVPHFASHPAMYCWVLQNEPGDGPTTGDYCRQYYDQWHEGWQREHSAYDNGYMKYSFPEENFTRFILSNYLSKIAAEVRKYDKVHGLHVNPHDICKTLPEYDFRHMSSYLTSLGASMHMSWHFWLFRRNEFPLGVSFMSDIIRQSACQNPFWVTELQGGNVTFSGRSIVCPTRQNISQWLWTAIAQGSEGVIFWSLNQRGSFMEAGEWGMVDFQGQPTERLDEASRIARIMQDERKFFASAKPVKSPVTLLYTNESFFVANKLGDKLPDAPEGRKATAPMRSLIQAYRSLTSMGLSPMVADAGLFDWNQPSFRGQTIMLTDMLALPSGVWSKLEQFVKRGGRLIVTGLSGYYDENCHNLYQTGHPLRSLLGGQLRELRYVSTPDCRLPMLQSEQQFGIQVSDIQMPAHLWLGSIRPDSGAKVIGQTSDGEALALCNKFGDGEVWWIPQCIELGAYVSDSDLPYRRLLAAMIPESETRVPVSLSEPQTDVMLRLMQSGNDYLAVIENISDAPASGNINVPKHYKLRKLFGEGQYSAEGYRLNPGQILVMIIEK